MAAKEISIARMALVLTLTCAVMGGSLSLVYDSTKPLIEKQIRLYKLKSVKAVLPAYDNEPDKDVIKIANVEVYHGRSNGQDVGYAFEWSNSEGYGGEIKILVGLDPQGNITGIEILPGHKETSGLGSKIQEPEFKNQFKGRNIENTSWAVDKDGGDIDSITGATISPRAVTAAVKEALEFFRANRDAIVSGGSTE